MIFFYGNFFQFSDVPKFAQAKLCQAKKDFSMSCIQAELSFGAKLANNFPYETRLKMHFQSYAARKAVLQSWQCLAMLMLCNAYSKKNKC